MNWISISGCPLLPTWNQGISWLFLWLFLAVSFFILCLALVGISICSWKESIADGQRCKIFGKRRAWIHEHKQQFIKPNGLFGPLVTRRIFKPKGLFSLTNKRSMINSNHLFLLVGKNLWINSAQHTRKI